MHVLLRDLAAGRQFRLVAGDVLVVVGQPHHLKAAASLIAGNSAAATQPQK
jgi:hypothetical protein